MRRPFPAILALLALLAFAVPAGADEGPAPRLREPPEKPVEKPGEKPGDAGDEKEAGEENGEAGGAQKPKKPGAEADPAQPAGKRPLLVGETLAAEGAVTLVPVPPEPVEGAAPDPVVVPALGSSKPLPLVLLFWSRNCPVCKRYVNRYAALAKEFGKQVRFVVVTANADELPADVVKALKEAALALPVYHDPKQAAATRLGVRVTPTVLVFDAAGTLSYRGPLDDDRKAKKSREPVEYLRKALRSVLEGKAVETPEPRPFGSAVRR